MKKILIFVGSFLLLVSQACIAVDSAAIYLGGGVDSDINFKLLYCANNNVLYSKAFYESLMIGDRSYLEEKDQFAKREKYEKNKRQIDALIQKYKSAKVFYYDSRYFEGGNKSYIGRDGFDNKGGLIGVNYDFEKKGFPVTTIDHHDEVWFSNYKKFNFLSIPDQDKAKTLSRLFNGYGDAIGVVRIYFRVNGMLKTDNELDYERRMIESVGKAKAELDKIENPKEWGLRRIDAQIINISVYEGTRTAAVGKQIYVLE